MNAPGGTVNSPFRSINAGLPPTGNVPVAGLENRCIRYTGVAVSVQPALARPRPTPPVRKAFETVTGAPLVAISVVVAAPLPIKPITGSVDGAAEWPKHTVNIWRLT